MKWHYLRMNFSIDKDEPEGPIKIGDIVRLKNTQEPVLYRVREIRGDNVTVELLKDLVIIRPTFNFLVSELTVLKKIKKSRM